MQRAEHQVSRQRGLDGNLRGFEVAHLSHHDAVRILTEEGTQRLGKGQPHGVIDRHLHDAVHFILHRVLRGDQLGVDRIDTAQRGIERGRLPRSGRPGDDEDAVRLLNRLHDVIKERFVHAEALQVQIHAGAVENAEHHGLPVLRGQAVHAHVHGFAVHRRHDAAVLRDAALRDVHVRHDFDAGNDGCGQMHRRRSHFIERAVHAVADFELALKGLEVNVARTLFDGLLHHQIDEFHDRGRIRLLLHALRGTGLAQLTENLLHARRTAAIVLVDERLHLGATCHHRHDALSETETQILGQLRIQRIGEGHMQPLPVQRDGKAAVKTCHAVRNQVHHRGRGLEVA